MSSVQKQIISDKSARKWLPPVLCALLLAGCASNPNARKAAYLNQGKRFIDAGKYQEAVIEYRNAIQIDPQSAEAHYHLGRSYLSLQNVESAYREFRSAVTLDPANRDAKLQLAGLLVTRKEFPEAEAMAKAVVRAEPQNVRAH